MYPTDAEPFDDGFQQFLASEVVWRMPSHPVCNIELCKKRRKRGREEREGEWRGGRGGEGEGDMRMREGEGGEERGKETGG